MDTRNSCTLVLDNCFRPLTRVGWQKAISWVLTGRVEVLEEYEDHVIHTVTDVFAVPSVVRFIKKITGFFKRNVRFNRRNIWLRDKGHCQYCGHKVSMSEFTYDHVHPQSQGGQTCWTNIVVCCMDCNRKKADRTPQQAGMRLMIKPARPTSVPSSDLKLAWPDIPDSWKTFLGSHMYWHGSLNS